MAVAWWPRCPCVCGPAESFEQRRACLASDHAPEQRQGGEGDGEDECGGEGEGEGDARHEGTHHDDLMQRECVERIVAWVSLTAGRGEREA